MPSVPFTWTVAHGPDTLVLSIEYLGFVPSSSTLWHSVTEDSPARSRRAARVSSLQLPVWPNPLTASWTAPAALPPPLPPQAASASTLDATVTASTRGGFGTWSLPVVGEVFGRKPRSGECAPHPPATHPGRYGT